MFIAYRARYRWLPLFSQFENVEQVKTGTEHLRKWVSIEFILALLLVLLATMLANTLPAKHAIIENWPYPFRFSIKATWEEPNVQEMVWTGTALLLVALATIWLGIKKNKTGKKKILVPSALGWWSLLWRVHYPRLPSKPILKPIKKHRCHSMPFRSRMVPCFMPGIVRVVMARKARATGSSCRNVVNRTG
nr:hypothetical protein [Nitrosomonas sp. Nm33]